MGSDEQGGGLIVMDWEWEIQRVWVVRNDYVPRRVRDVRGGIGMGALI